MPKYNDYPLQECADTVQAYIDNGMYVYQKFTCDHCGSRQTMGDANVFYKTGTCEECKKVTDIDKKGCNYLLTSHPMGVLK